MYIIVTTGNGETRFKKTENIGKGNDENRREIIHTRVCCL